MKVNRIIAGMLVMIGFGSCCNRPAKSKAPQENPEEVTVDTTSVIPIRVMYGPPRPGFNPEKIRQSDTPEAVPAETTDSETAAVE